MASYIVGKKPDFLKEGVKYTSPDGANFIDANGKAAGKSYAYFQYVSPRVPTNYSAAELDAYIDSELAAKEKTGYTKYANATTKSQLKGLGATLKEVEKEHRLNALFILSFAIHESDYGMSCHAQNNNNLFGLNIPDSNDQCSPNGNTSSTKYFASIEENIAAVVDRLNTNYLDPLNMKDYRYNGVALGNKMIWDECALCFRPILGCKNSRSYVSH